MTLPTLSLGPRSGLRASAIGLGCSRLGSTLGGCTDAAAERLVRHALESGVTLFDTADIYGQGESERLIGAALRGRREEAVIVTKAGQRFTPAQRMAALAKAPLRQLARRLPGLKEAIASRRAAPLPRDYSPAHLQRAIEGSLRRLQVERVDLFLLHSPSAAVVERAEFSGLLNRLVQEGKLRAWGVSCDDAECVRAALRLPAVAALQVPLELAEALRPEMEAAARQGVGLMLREIFAGRPATAAAREAAIRAALALPQSLALVGTTSAAHLDEALGFAQRTRTVEAAT
ncbi:aldo/keto reductase [Roseomonas sp. M0104]|uniref:Aldo/keto reductase n=1 Tax=Teichococcus coralli TaxID=2545983 RepID=A0A845BBY7_9PROT|nr:aldo/keto reductase [Pseudoroseomonas coralli]MXP64661.1 aldo/keto reductase [Pseudoroseomonas coralli]